VIDESALQEKLINMKPNSPQAKLIMETVIPELTAFKALMVIRNIELRKAEEEKKAKKDGKPLPEEDKDPMQMTE